jgi:geranylgeranyl diphosphate synthase, type II
MITLKQAQDIINESIDKIKFDSKPKELYEPIIYTLSFGGKRIRPALILLGCNLFSEDIHPAVNPAIAFELLHNFTLVHDDMMDNANLRRGKQTVHSKWGNNVALLSGDAMCIKAYEYINKSDERYLKAAIEAFTEAAIKVCEGQQFDMNFETRQSVSEEEYLKMIGLKTSALFASSLKTGAIVGGASVDDANLMCDFGLNLGYAFQLQDDYLDIFGDETSIGKEIGKDIVSNKKTYLLIKALELAKGSRQESLKKWIFAKKFDPEEKIKAVQLIYISLGIRELTLKAIENYFIKAYDDLKKIGAPDNRKLELKNFLSSLRNRKY